MKLCSLTACVRRHYARGWCEAHYRLWQRHGTPAAPARARELPCGEPGCPARGYARGWCTEHFDSSAGRPAGGVCAVAGCASAAVARGWCKWHYRGWHRHGDPLAARPRRTPAPCAAGGCNRIAVGHGWCPMHYSRWYRHGSPDIVKSAPSAAGRGEGL